MIQQIIVAAIGVAVAIYIGVHIYGLVTRRKNPCASCSGCDLRDAFMQKQKECKENPTKRGSTGCGCGC